MTDHYLSTSACVDRLYAEWLKHGQLIVATDFDDTVFPFHNTDHTHDRVLELLRKCTALNFYIVVFTASHKDRFPMMRAYLEERGIKVSAINENAIPLPFGLHGKIYYNVFLDDRAGLGQAYDTLWLTLDRIGLTLASKSASLGDHETTPPPQPCL